MLLIFFGVLERDVSFCLLCTLLCFFLDYFQLFLKQNLGCFRNEQKLKLKNNSKFLLKTKNLKIFLLKTSNFVFLCKNKKNGCGTRKRILEFMLFENIDARWLLSEEVFLYKMCIRCTHNRKPGSC
jgi:hypothetical protein